MEVTVAVMMSEWPSFSTKFEGIGQETAWDDRPKATLTVQDDETILDVLVRAAEQLGVEVAADVAEYGEGTEIGDNLHFFALQPVGDDTAIRAGMQYRTAYVAEDGTAYWNEDFKVVKWGDLVRAVDAGLIPDRDPQRLYLILSSPAGNGAGFDWSNLVMSLSILGNVVQGMADVEGASQFVKRIWERVRRSNEAFQGSFMELEERGALPGDLAASLGSGPWLPAELAERIGVSEDRAQGILEGFGFAPADSGLYRLKADREATFLYDLREETEIARVDGDNALRPDIALRDRLTEYLETEQRPELPEYFGEPHYSELTEEEALARSRELDRKIAEESAEFEEDYPGEGIGLEGMGMGPIDRIILKCGCSDSSCAARMSFAKAGSNLRMELENIVDHFEASSSFLGSVAFQAEEEDLPPDV